MAMCVILMIGCRAKSIDAMHNAYHRFHGTRTDEEGAVDDEDDDGSLSIC